MSHTAERFGTALTIPTESVAAGPTGDDTYRARAEYRATYLYPGQTVMIPRYNGGTVTHWETAKIRTVTVTVDADGGHTPWFSAQYADGELWGGFSYSIADPTTIGSAVTGAV